MASLVTRVAAILMMAATMTAAGCTQSREGAIRVLAIGDPPKVRDAAVSQLSATDELLLGNVAQGLVRFDAAGNIVGGLAERWNVSDDGLSYIFRITAAKWPDGTKVTAQQVARALKRQLAVRSTNSLKDAMGAIEDVVAMTDRVIEVRLIAPRPNLLPLLAQPQFGVLRNGHGTGPFSVEPAAGTDGELRLSSEVINPDEEVARREELVLAGVPAPSAVRAFASGQADLVLGGSFVDLPYARAVKLPRNSLRYDPAAGLFGLVPASSSGPFADVEARRLLSQAIDRAALVASLDVPGLVARATVLEAGLGDVPSPAQPAWFATPLADRLAAMQAESARQFGSADRPTIRVNVPEGPGGRLLLSRLATDWGRLGLKVEYAETARSADFVLVDRVAPSASAAWYLRSFRCGVARVCDAEADELLASARTAPVPAQRYALLAQAAARIDAAQLFLPLAAPVRWSLVSVRIPGFSGNRYARHPLTDLEQRLGRGGP